MFAFKRCKGTKSFPNERHNLPKKTYYAAHRIYKNLFSDYFPEAQPTLFPVFKQPDFYLNVFASGRQSVKKIRNILQRKHKRLILSHLEAHRKKSGTLRWEKRYFTMRKAVLYAPKSTAFPQAAHHGVKNFLTFTLLRNINSLTADFFLSEYISSYRFFFLTLHRL